MRSAWLVLMALLMAGCTSAPGPEAAAQDAEPASVAPTDDAPIEAPAEVVPQGYGVTGCMQEHAVFMVPAEIFGPPPDGFAYAGQDGMVNVLYALSACEGVWSDVPVHNGTLHEIWNGVEVIPDAPGEGAASHYVVLDVYTDHAGVAALLDGHAWGSEADITLTAAAPGEVTRVDRWLVEDGDFVFIVDVGTTGGSGQFDAATARWWFVGDETRSVTVEASAGVDGGAGAAFIQFQSVDPPAWPGIGHRVSGVTATTTFDPVPA